jgi:SAM-dependent methyltransferase
VKDAWLAGSGTISPLMFGRRNPSVRFLATDLSRRSLWISRTRLFLYGIKNVQFEIEDILSATHQNSFDAIDCYGVIHHTVSPPKSLDRLSKALRKGGVLRLMVYSHDARAEIESLKARVQELKLSRVGEIRAWLKSEKVETKGDLSSSYGIADALLHPISSVFTEEQFVSLLKPHPELRLLRMEDKSNFVAYLKKIS